MSKVGKRYARALFDSSSTEEIELTSAVLNSLATSLAGSEELQRVLANPSIRPDERLACLHMLGEAVLDKTGSKLSSTAKETVLKFLEVIFQAGRVGAMTEIASEFQKLVIALRQLVSIEIESAHPLTEEQLAAIKAGLGEKYKQLATTKIKDTPGLVSGVRIKIGDTIVDSSVRGRLDSIRAKLMAS